MFKKIIILFICLSLFPIMSVIGAESKKQIFMETATYESVAAAVSSSTPLYDIYKGKKFEVQFVKESGIIVRKAPPGYKYLSEEERSKAEAYLARYQNDVLNQNNSNKVNYISPEKYFSEEEYALILKNQQDHELKYIPTLINSNYGIDSSDTIVNIEEMNKQILDISNNLTINSNKESKFIDNQIDEDLSFSNIPAQTASTDATSSETHNETSVTN